jgi:hypothetical protein
LRKFPKVVRLDSSDLQVFQFPKVVRLDSSDLQVFLQAAAPGEWAVPGSFAFSGARIEALTGKDRLAFAHGWLGTESFGYAALVEHFVERYRAPGLGEALPAARSEADYAAGLADHKVHQLLALEREEGPKGLVERIRLVRPERADSHAKIWQIVDDDDVGEAGGGGIT